jgi:hypothetical protein
MDACAAGARHHYRRRRRSRRTSKAPAALAAYACVRCIRLRGPAICISAAVTCRSAVRSADFSAASASIAASRETPYLLAAGPQVWVYP